MSMVVVVVVVVVVQKCSAVVKIFFLKIVLPSLNLCFKYFKTTNN